MINLTREAKRKGWTEAHLKKEWVGLTDDERDEIREQAHYEFDDISNAIEAKLKEKNAC